MEIKKLAGDILITAANGSSKLVGKHAILKGLLEKNTVHGGFMILGESDNPYFTELWGENRFTKVGK